jgi:predicted dehydrogenase
MGLGLGIIGLGNFGAKIIEPINRFYQREELYVAAICDIDAKRVAEVGKSIDAQCFTNYMECIDHPEVDIVYVAVPPALHKEIVLYALSAKKHILCEKPLAHDLEDARVLMEEANKVDVVTAMHFGQQYSPVFNTFRSYIKQGKIGEIKRIELTMDYQVWPPEWQKTDWLMTKSEGGFLLEQGVHFIQFLRLLFGEMNVRQSTVAFLPGDGCETSVDAELVIDQQIPFSLKGNWPAQAENV